MAALSVTSALRGLSITSIGTSLGYARMFWVLIGQHYSWVSTRLDVLGQMFTASLAFYLVYGNVTRNASSVGFVLSMAGTPIKCYL